MQELKTTIYDETNGISYTLVGDYYSDFTTYVITHNGKGSTENIRFTKEGPAVLVKKLKSEDGENIWSAAGRISSNS